MLYIVETIFRIYYFLDGIFASLIFGTRFKYAAKSTIAIRGGVFLALCIAVLLSIPNLSAAVGIRVIGWFFTLILLAFLLLMIYCAHKMSDLILKKNGR